MTNTATSPTIPPRPRYYDDAVRETAVDGILEDVCEWLQDNAQFEESRVREALLRCLDTNGYEYAQNLARRHGWAPDARLVEILDGLSLDAAHRKACIDWVKAHDVKVPFEVGALVSTVRYAKAKIFAIEEKYGWLIVQDDAWTHGDGGHIINFEDAIPIIGTIDDAAPAEGGAA
ncbi:hypothetical protein [Agrobacterium tumefaciens]|uniref:hypothetical protein n=1 Tax=Agrobacterium tumefaciens TaxID=358 RepID=UPI0021CF6A6E|nr:hypothetical protein [Agrobacterium tumefaciens]UXS01126.1 hypothetical protein FY156_06285 [Agrobacterium tumefaciens]